MEKNNKLIIILLGPPGSGKGTQAELLVDKFGLEYIGSGELLRNRKKKRDFSGQKISQTIDKGKRVPTPVIFYLWMGKLEEFKNKKKFKGVIVDGSPRTKTEAEMFELALGWYGWEKGKKVIFIDLPDKDVVWRLTKRRICGQCSRNIPYVGDFKKLKKCDHCGGKLISRPDDTPRGVRERLRWYRSEVKPAINYFKKKGELIKIDGDQSIEAVFKDVLKAIKK